MKKNRGHEKLKLKNYMKLQKFIVVSEIHYSKIKKKSMSIKLLP